MTKYLDKDQNQATVTLFNVTCTHHVFFFVLIVLHQKVLFCHAQYFCIKT